MAKLSGWWSEEAGLPDTDGYIDVLLGSASLATEDMERWDRESALDIIRSRGGEVRELESRNGEGLAGGAILD